MFMKQVRILFVCLGNICRSAAADGMMRKLVRDAGKEGCCVIDSAGISSYHQGELPDARMVAHAARRGYVLNHRSRPVTVGDFADFDLIIGMDDSNIRALHDLAPTPEAAAKIRRMTDYCVRHAGVSAVPDPYYGGEAGFEYVLDILEDALSGLLQSVASVQDN